VQAASVARQREIGGFVAPTVFSGDHVVNVEGTEGRGALGETAVLATIPCAPANQGTDGAVHLGPSGGGAVRNHLVSLGL
jgi:hypothetical protein